MHGESEEAHPESEGSLDHTSIEEFRNRFGTKGAKLITRDMMRVAKEFCFTKADDVDMDTRVQEAGRSALSRNLSLPMRDLNEKAMDAVPQC